MRLDIDVRTSTERLRLHAGLRSSAGEQNVECSLYDIDQQCMKLELQEGATTLTSISDCNASSTPASISQAVDLTLAQGKPYTLGASSASKFAGTAAVGGAVGTPLRASTEGECLFACASYVQNCEIVTTSTSLTSSEEWSCGYIDLAW